MAAFEESPLGGLLGARTASFYRLDPTGTVPIEPIADLRPAFTPNRVVLDMVDTEDIERTYQVTANALQDFTSATSNVHRDLIRLTVSGTLISGIDLPFVGAVGLGGVPGFGGGLRADLLKIANLEALADAREPIMVVTPRVSLPKAFIESISRGWSPEQGENTLVTVSLVEARVVNPLSADAAVPDVAGSNTGNNATVAAGAQSPLPVQTQTVTPPPVFGAAPNVVPFF
jgi:hypothetical protein